MKKKRILVDMSATIIHHGHIRLLKKASRYGKVIVALTRDIEIKKNKGYYPELNFKSRKEILSSIKYVDRVIPSNFLVNEKFLKKNKIDILIHGTDSPHGIKNKNKLIILPRTRGISSSKIRKRVKNSLKQLKKFRGK
tara:strand:- start:25 stop:438 length:414 start_codon:yes stop_codon:yes gene_type:complete